MTEKDIGELCYKELISWQVPGILILVKFHKQLYLYICLIKFTEHIAYEILRAVTSVL
jgi:hypothetical protein